MQTTIFLSPESASASSALLLPLVALDRRDDALGPFKASDGILQLTVDHVAIRDDQHRVKDLLVVGVVQVAQKVSRPGDGVRLAGTGGMLDQVLVARSFFQDRGQQLTSHIQLMEAREDDRLDVLLVVTLGDQVATQDVQPAVSLPDLFPQVGGLVTVGIQRDCRRRSVVALVERQEVCLRSSQLASSS